MFTTATSTTSFVGSLTEVLITISVFSASIVLRVPLTVVMRTIDIVPSWSVSAGSSASTSASASAIVVTLVWIALTCTYARVLCPTHQLTSLIFIPAGVCFDPIDSIADGMTLCNPIED